MAVTITLHLASPQIPPQQMTRLHPDGVFEVLFSGQTTVFPYQLEVVRQNGEWVTIDDPYRFPSTNEFDLYLGEGTHYQQYEKFGAHRIYVWAPTEKAPLYGRRIWADLGVGPQTQSRLAPFRS